jgi:glucose/arabinose dehydrogenase
MLRLIRYGVFTLTFTLLSTTVYAQDAGSSGLPDQLETLDYTLNVDVLAEGLENPWAIDFIDTQTALVTEQSGDVHMIESGRLRAEPVAGLPEALYAGQGGMLDVAVDPDYQDNGWIYLAYSHALGEGDNRPAMTRVVRGHIRNNAWTDQQVLFEAPHDTYRTSRHHYGSRIVFDAEGRLYFSIGDRGAQSQAQDLSRPNGKVHRIHRDGSIPSDNPFVGRDDALPSVFSYGHRNPQGLAIHPETDALWGVEHGPRGGDELNRIVAGRNYGWPVITYGINYDGTIITEERAREGMEQPVLYWRPSIAVSGLDVYDGQAFPYWRNHLLVGALRDQEVRLLSLAGNHVQHQEVILKNAGRVREAVTGPDGAIYVVVNAPGAILRLSHMRDTTARTE